MNDILYSILQVFITAAIAVILRYLIPFLTGVLREHDYNFAADIVDTIVRAAEQTFIGQGRGDQKFEWVVTMAKKQFDKYGIAITDDQLVQLLEAAVHTMNNEAGIIIPSEEVDEDEQEE